MASRSSYVGILLLIALSLCNSIKVPLQINNPKDDVTSPATPGFKTTLTQNGLNYFASVGVTKLNQAVSTITIPDMAGDSGSPIGHIEWTLSNIVIQSLNLQQSSIVINPNVGLTLSLTASCTVNMDWHYKMKKFPHTSDTGSATISVTGTSIVVALQVTASNGRPVLNVVSDSVNVGDLNIQFHGGASWLYNFFVSTLHDPIKNAIQQALAARIPPAINVGGNAALSTLRVVQKISDQVSLDFSIVGQPSFGTGFFTLPQAGEFVATASPQDCPSNICPEVALPDIQSSNMVSMVISEYSANSAAFVFKQLGQLAVTVVDSQIPSWSPIRLNTTAFKYLVPALYLKYPNQLMQLNIYATQTPSIQFSTGGAAVNGVGNIDFNVVMPNGAVQLAFTLNGTITSTGIAVLSGQTIVGNLTYIKGDYGLGATNIGPVSVAIFQNLLNALFSSGVLPAINKVLAVGFPLPTMDGVNFVNPNLSWGTGYLTLATDINYVPPASVYSNIQF